MTAAFQLKNNCSTYSRSIQSVRKSFEDELKLKQANQENLYRLAIRYEILVLEATQERSKALFKSSEHDHKDLAKLMIDRIRVLFDDVVRQYPGNLNSWYEYFRFLAKSRLWKELSKKIKLLIDTRVRYCCAICFPFSMCFILLFE